MPDVSANPKLPAATELAWLDDPSIAPQLVRLTAGTLRLVIAPAIGGALAAFYESTANGPLHWLRPASHAAFTGQDPLRMASFRPRMHTMIPIALILSTPPTPQDIH